MRVEEQIDVIPPEVYRAPVAGLNLRAGTLDEELGDELTLMVFLRHFGCCFCRAMVEELRELSATDLEFPPILFVHRGSPERGADFFARHWPGARAVADPERHLYGTFGLGRIEIRNLLCLDALANRLRARARGYRSGLPTGDPLLMPGVFLVQRDTILWQHRFRNAGDLPDFSDIPLVAVELS
jgi:hypothetical protein